jgi:carbamoyltransferase
MDNKGNCKVLNEMLYPESSPGELYNVFNHHVGFREGEQGKTMGLAAYGKPDFFRQLEKHLDLQDNGSFTFMDTEDIKRALSDYVPARKQGEEITREHMNAAYAGQALIELIVTNAFKAALTLSGLRDLVYAGGIALNSVANEIACEETKPQKIYIAPNPGDTGHALGCVLYGAYELAGWDPPTREMPEYLGPPYSLQEMEAAAKSGKFPYTNCNNIEHTIARCIANGCIVARFDGGAEFGPRALGNRSILCDPRRPDMKDYLNARVKHREGFRPYAPTVLEEHASKWFEVEERSSYMLRVAPVREEMAKKIPAVVHVDNSARLQTLARHENPGYWRIIDAFYRLTGVPLVLNTSFNVAGKPIVEKPIDAVECFKSTEIDILILGPFILSKGPLDHYLENSR